MFKRITVLSSSFTLIFIFAVSAALNEISVAFPDVSKSLVQMLVSIPSLVGMVFILLSGFLTCWMRKKTIIIISLALMLVGGCLPILFHDQFFMLIIAAVIMGIGYGAMSPLTSALIMEHFGGGDQLKMLGYQSAVIGIGGMLFSYFGGKLAAACWWHVYYAHLLILPPLVLCLFLPKGKLSKKPSAELDYSQLFNKKNVIIGLQGALTAVFFCVFQTNAAMFIAEKGFGSAELAAKAFSFQSAIGIISGFFGGWILNKLDDRSLATFMLIGSMGLLALYVYPCSATIFVAAALLGSVQTLRNPAGYRESAKNVTPALETMAVSCFCGATQVGQFFSPIVVNSLGSLFGLDSRNRFFMCGLALLALGCLSLVCKRHGVVNTNVGQ